MQNKLLAIGQTANLLGVSIQTLRRWDKDGTFRPTEVSRGGHRLYGKQVMAQFVKDHPRLLFKAVKSWAYSKKPYEPLESLYCQNSFVFQTRLQKMQTELEKTRNLQKSYPLVVAIAGEIGNNSFDHNLGNWRDIPGIFFGYDTISGVIALADRGQGVLTTLKRIRPALKNDEEALNIAFTEIISERSPESQGNNLKFVREVIAANNFHLRFCSGRAELQLGPKSDKPKIIKTAPNFHGCLALIQF